jgi:hydrogenase maturation factor
VTADVVPAESLARAALTLARRFEAGATMWCVSPDWRSHGRHVAVEFVHPVIVGKRALPAVHVGDEDLAGALRPLVRAGDVLTAIGPDSPELEALMRRAEAWGLVTLWLGAGPRPATITADHVIWASSADTDRALHSGEVVILYHLLWELTHVVYEHPGLLSEPSGGDAAVCLTCSDEGRIAEVVAVGASGQALVMAGGKRESVDVSLVDPVRSGDLLLIHAGAALTRLDV